MIKVIILGSGNVAQHLINAFETAKIKHSEVHLIQVFSRKKDALTHLLNPDRIVTQYKHLLKADLYILAVTDDAIQEVASQLPFINRLVVHTSGSADLRVLDGANRKGVFYPLQTFTKNKAIAFKTIPICLETQRDSDYKIVETVARSLSDSVFAITSEQRKALHLGAVFVNNFTNQLYQIGCEICEQHQVPFEILKPIIVETANKIMVLSPLEAQTGPAKRNDITTIEAHEAFISNKNHLAIYKILTQAIQDNGKKL